MAGEGMEERQSSGTPADVREVLLLEGMGGKRGLELGLELEFRGRHVS